MSDPTDPLAIGGTAVGSGAVALGLIRLLFGGAQCGDAETLEAKNVKAGDSLHMVLALRGGC